MHFIFDLNSEILLETTQIGPLLKEQAKLLWRICGMSYKSVLGAKTGQLFLFGKKAQGHHKVNVWQALV